MVSNVFISLIDKPNPKRKIVLRACIMFRLILQPLKPRLAIRAYSINVNLTNNLEDYTKWLTMIVLLLSLVNPLTVL